jgi:hypothetical protein
MKVASAVLLYLLVANNTFADIFIKMLTRKSCDNRKILASALLEKFSGDEGSDGRSIEMHGCIAQHWQQFL